MALFVVQHTHASDSCPARDPRMGAALLAHLSPENARRFEVDLHGEAVVDGAHSLYLIVDAPDADRVGTFMAPFAQAGSVQVLPASRCELVVDRGGC